MRTLSRSAPRCQQAGEPGPRRPGSPVVGTVAATASHGPSRQDHDLRSSNRADCAHVLRECRADAQPRLGASNQFGRSSRITSSHVLRADYAGAVAVTPAKLAQVGGRPADGDSDELFDYCARPACNESFFRNPGPGRRQDYCSEACRRLAEKELREIRRKLAHFDHVVDKLRRRAAAYGRPGEVEGAVDEPDELVRKARDALLGAQGALRYAPPDNPVTEDLRMLAEAVEPLLKAAVARAS